MLSNNRTSASDPIVFFSGWGRHGCLWWQLAVGHPARVDLHDIVHNKERPDDITKTSSTWQAGSRNTVSAAKSSNDWNVLITPQHISHNPKKAQTVK